MEKFSALLTLCAGNSPVPGEFPSQRPVTRSFDVFFDLRLNQRLSKQWWGWWFETLQCPLWRHCNGYFPHYTPLYTSQNHYGITHADIFSIDTLHKFHNELDKYPTIRNFVTEMCTRVHIFVTKWYLVEYLSHALWDLWDGCIRTVHPFPYIINNEWFGIITSVTSSFFMLIWK